MWRIYDLDRFQKVMLILLAAMAVISCVIYFAVTSRVGILYMDEILEVSQDGGNTVYSGRIYNQECRFVVTPEKTVTFHCDMRTYGPYTAKEDPTAIPKNEYASYMTGIELRDGDVVIFRGGILNYGSKKSGWMMYNEDGTFANLIISVTSSNGIVTDKNGNPIDPMEPSAFMILRLMEGPELTNKGFWPAWFGGVFLSILAALSVIFADDLFRWRTRRLVRDYYSAEPSELELVRRYFGWILDVVVVFALYFMGLQFVP